MRRFALLAVILVFAAAASALLWFGYADSFRREAGLSGYLEGDLLYMSAPINGVVRTVHVIEGQRVKAGAPLFDMDSRQINAQRDQAVAQITASQAQIAVAEANLAQMRATAAGLSAQAANAQKTFNRDMALRKANPGAISEQTVDNDRTTASNMAAQRDAALKQVDAAKAQLNAAQSNAVQSKAALANIDVQLGQLHATAPVAARVQSVFYQSGEWTAANQPIIALLPDNKVKVRFFVPERALSLYQPGRRVKFRCDGCPAGLHATISYVSSQPEYTPPIIYSEHSRDKLVFMVEALPDHPKELSPGQPVEVAPLSPVRKASR